MPSTLRRARPLAALLLVPALSLTALAGCGSDEDDQAGGSTSEATATAGSTPGATPGATPSAATCETQEAGAGGVEVTGEPGAKPELTLPEGEPAPTTLTRQVLTEGDGEPVESGDLLVAGYLGKTWKEGTVFDNSYDRGQPAAFPIGVGQVIPGWDACLVGLNAGTRTVLTIPPAQGYGDQAQGEIPAGSTLVFVVDVVGSAGADAAGEADASQEELPAQGPQVEGELGQRPTVTVPEGTAEPTEPGQQVVATGSGDPVEAGQLVVMQYEVVDWTGQPVESTWETGTPYGGPVGVQGQGSPFDGLVGVPVGSRVLLTIPAQGEQTPPYAVVVDVVAAY
ncbi:FKBP-type peptidyl-prolyl cis-trans isomerase [Vallicoccus soli]|uniref:FKBP-type peptidyl-prolyl cis-trans isomerase n=1 Tax=Vallicoccus soli TaxID=2339232 RepID=UPI001401F01E|nr:FKBP-type peptidyl-prolyl cis-trans isomerase [Vallicoccus soli]